MPSASFSRSLEAANLEDLGIILAIVFTVVFAAVFTPYLMTTIGAINFALWTCPGAGLLALILPFFPEFLDVTLGVFVIYIAWRVHSD